MPDGQPDRLAARPALPQARQMANGGGGMSRQGDRPGGAQRGACTAEVNIRLGEERRPGEYSRKECSTWNGEEASTDA
jgi:hypothetical protein